VSVRKTSGEEGSTKGRVGGECGDRFSTGLIPREDEEGKTMRATSKEEETKGGWARKRRFGGWRGGNPEKEARRVGKEIL